MARYHWPIPDPDPQHAQDDSDETAWQSEDPEDDDDEREYGRTPCPLPSFPELYADLDIALLAAPDEEHRWAALTDGTREVLARFDYLASYGDTNLPEPQRVLRDLRSAADLFTEFGANVLADWMNTIVDIAAEQDDLHRHCLRHIGTAADQGRDQATAAITEAAASLNAAAEAVAIIPIPAPPKYTHPNRGEFWIAAIQPFWAELSRNPLSVNLAGAGGLAGSPEYNPYVAALCALELATHRRFYRLFYEVVVHAGIDTSDESIYRHPDLVDREMLTPRRQ